LGIDSLGCEARETGHEDVVGKSANAASYKRAGETRKVNDGPNVFRNAVRLVEPSSSVGREIVRESET
jgi:hypothetical protein